MTKSTSLPYRPCVGVVLINADNLCWIGRRADAREDTEGPGHWWQMPQGGIDAGEDPRDAAIRELFEETSIRSASVIAEAPGWFTYDLPEHLIGKAWKGRYRGQKQKWFALRFHGSDDEIDILNPPGGHRPEFSAWQWERLEALPDLVVPFKAAVYRQVVGAFADLVANRSHETDR